MENKTPKNIFEAIRNAKEINHSDGFNDSFTKTDFRPKKKPSIKERLKKSITKFFSNIKNSKLIVSVKNWFYNKFIKPNEEKRAKKDHDNYVKELKDNFSKKFNVDVEKTINIMSQPGYSPYQYDNDALLVENRIQMNKTKDILGNRMSPFLYEPDITDIHNENLHLNKNNPTFKELVKIQDSKASDSMFKQHEFLRKRPHLTVGGRKRR